MQKWMDSVSEELTGLVGKLAWALAVLYATILIVLGKEIARIYKAHGFKRSPIAYALWGAAAFVIVVWMLAAWFNNGLSSYLQSWSFFGYIITIEGADQYEQRVHQLPPGSDDQSYGEDI